MLGRVLASPKQSGLLEILKLFFFVFVFVFALKYCLNLCNVFLCLGLGCGLLYTATVTITCQYFDSHRGLALGLISTGTFSK